MSNSKPIDHNQRLVELSRWLSEILGSNITSIAPASEDASFRRYFRVEFDSKSFIAMDAPPDLENIEPFVCIARRFRQCGLSVPEIHAVNNEQGYILMSDFGSTTYLNVLSDDNADSLYGDAINSLITLQSATKDDPGFLPDYGASLLKDEMELFRTWYLGRHFANYRRSSDNEVLDYAFEHLTHHALQQPRVWVHLDYHSRNLMQIPQANPGILDFQDARYGPITYDLVSLLRDCYIKWPQDRINKWIKQYRDKAQQADLHIGSEADFMQWFDMMGIQRHLKATGIFARLNHRDNKPQFIKDIPRVLSYICTVSARYRELQPLHDLVAHFLDMEH